MVQIANPKDDNDPNSDSSNKDNNTKTERYQVDPSELTFPKEGLINAKIVDQKNATAQQTPVTEVKTPEQIEKERIDRLAYDDKDLVFIHLPDDPAYKPISLELVKMNQLDNEDLKLNTRIMMNIALSDYVIFRELNDDGDIIDNVKINFRRVRTNEFQEYVDLQTSLDDLVKRVGIIEMTYPFTLELQDKLYETQKRLLTTARQRVRKGYDIFFKWENQEFRNKMYDLFDNNDLNFNVDSAFVRLTKSPFLRRKSSHSS